MTWASVAQPNLDPPDFNEVLHKHMKPQAKALPAKETRPNWENPPVNITEDFLVAVGPNAGGTDGMGCERKPAEWSYTTFNGGPGRIYAVKEGYAVASGTQPILAGRRVRAASDGTQFAIEVIRDKNDQSKYIERVYFLNTRESKPIKIRVYNDAEQNGNPQEYALSRPGQFFELRDGVQPTCPSGTISGGNVGHEPVYFSGQMYLLLTTEALLIEGYPALRVGEAVPLARTASKHTLMSLFVQQAAAPPVNPGADVPAQNRQSLPAERDDSK